MEKEQLFTDLFNGHLPKRVPISSRLPFEACVEYKNLPLKKTYWTLEGVEDAYETLCKVVKSDVFPISTEVKHPAVLEILGSRGYLMSSTGHIQHNDLMTMYEDEYKALIEKPMDFLFETVLQRMFQNIEGDGIKTVLKFGKAAFAYYERQEQITGIVRNLVKKYRFFSPPPNSSVIVRAPFDILSDFLRGFKGISKDLRKHPEMVGRACEALLPFQIRRGLPENITKTGSTFIPLHFAGYMRTKDFEKLYWPSLKKFVEVLYGQGQTCELFCEHDWMRYLDHLYELPPGTRLIFEYGDPQKIKDKLGKRHIISGLYPLSYLKTATKDEAIDKAKMLMDILAPSGNYIFGFDKNPLTMSSINFDNYCAVLEYVSKNGDYQYAGEPISVEERKVVASSKAEMQMNPDKNFYLVDGLEMDDLLENIYKQHYMKYDNMLMTMIMRYL